MTNRSEDALTTETAFPARLVETVTDAVGRVPANAEPSAVAQAALAASPIAAMAQALKELIELCENAGDFSSGVVTQDGLDEGEWVAIRCIDRAHAVLAAYEGDARWLYHSAFNYLEPACSTQSVREGARSSGSGSLSDDQR